MEKVYSIDDMAFKISSFAVQAMLYEVSCSPSPGLVSANPNGNQKGTNYYRVIENTSCLIKYLTLCSESGFSNQPSKDIFKAVREIGVCGEHEICSKTSGVNSFKGILFLMGLCCAAVCKAIHDGKDFKAIRNTIVEMTKGITERELHNLSGKPESELTHGEMIYLKYGFEGIRGEVERGLPIIFEFALDFYKENSELSLNDRMVQTFLGIMQHCNDSHILYTHSKEILEEVKRKAQYIISIGAMRTKVGRKAIELLNDEYISKKINPTGSADLLAVTIFFNLIEDYMQNGYRVEQ